MTWFMDVYGKTMVFFGLVGKQTRACHGKNIVLSFGWIIQIILKPYY